MTPTNTMWIKIYPDELKFLTHRTVRKESGHCFMPLYFEVICYVAVDNLITLVSYSDNPLPHRCVMPLFHIVNYVADLLSSRFFSQIVFTVAFYFEVITNSPVVVRIIWRDPMDPLPVFPCGNIVQNYLQHGITTKILTLI